MTEVRLTGLRRDHHHRYSWDGGPWHPGITTVIGTLDKSGVLTGWAQRETARAAIRNLDTLQRMVEQGGPDNAVQWLKSMPGYQRDTAADIGTRVHAMAEAISRGESPPIPIDILPYVTSYKAGFLDGPLLMDGTRLPPPVFDPFYTEFMVYSETHEYGGTMDVACVIGDEWWLIDYKTAGDKPIVAGPRGFPYPETGLQLAGGRFADFVGRIDDPVRYPIPPVTRFGVVAITRAETRLIPYRVDLEEEYEVFVALRRAHRWVSERSKSVKEAA